MTHLGPHQEGVYDALGMIFTKLSFVSYLKMQFPETLTNWKSVIFNCLN